MLRAGPFSDERIIRLANRRFVPFYFDLADRGHAGDRDARRFVVARKKAYGGRSVPTPNLLLMNAEGELLGEVSNYASEDKVLAAMQRVLRRHPSYAAWGEAEKRAAPLAKARIRIDLLDYDGAREELKEIDGDEAHYLRGRLARFAQDWTAMNRHFARVEDATLADDVRMETAYRAWHGEDWQELRKMLEAFPETSNRYTEARYYEGLAHHHSGDVAKARQIWKSTIEGCAEDPWIYRADWAYCNAGQKRGGRRGRVVFSSNRKGDSLLGRIGYMGRRNPDLDGPRKR